MRNKLLAALLLHLGYEVQPLAARVWLDDGSTLRQPTWPLQTHLCLIASVDTKSFLCDVGFGKLGLSEPLPLELLDQESVVNGHCRVKLLSSQRKTVQGLEYSVYTLWHDGPSGTAWIRGYSFLPAQDFDLLDTLPLNTHVFGHYESNFTQSLWFEKRNGTEHARILGKTFLRNGKETPITSATQIQQLLLQHFDLRLPLQLCQRIQGLGQLDTPQKRWGGVLATRALKAAPRVRSGARAAALRPLLAGLLAVLAVCFWLRPLLPHGVLTMSEDSEFAWGQGT
ncbi:unnamed protein product [Effrenium voratum]|nr:unnamed protein product [Effrenium voratum]